MLGELLAIAGAAESPLATVLMICDLIPDRFEYRRGATYVDSQVADLLEAGAGVCQDFVHLALCLLRHHGIAARYVSGYLFAAGPDQVDESVEVDTHAWLEALLPISIRRARERSRSGSAPTRPTARSPARRTSRSATVATTPTCRRSRASIAARRAPSSTRA